MTSVFHSIVLPTINQSKHLAVMKQVLYTTLDPILDWLHWIINDYLLHLSATGQNKNNTLQSNRIKDSTIKNSPHVNIFNRHM